jgi:hypothetical protein
MGIRDTVNYAIGLPIVCHVEHGVWHGVEDNVMKGPTKPVVIEISEEAYKQNTVYRPWIDASTDHTIKADHASSSNSGNEQPIRAVAR